MGAGRLKAIAANDAVDRSTGRVAASAHQVWACDNFCETMSWSTWVSLLWMLAFQKVLDMCAKGLNHD